MRLIFGIKPTRIHLGHILSVFDFIKKEKYKKFNIDKSNIYCLIGDIHKLSSMEDVSSFEEEVKYISNISQTLGIGFYRQSQITKEYFILYHILSYFCNINRLTKVFNINYLNNTNNNFAKFSYPLLMCTDIISMQPCIVLVSKDQIHNIRFIKHIIDKINNIYNLNISVKFEIIDVKISNLHNNNKMSTRENKGAIYLSLEDEEIYKLVMKAKTQNNVPDKYENIEKSTENIYNIYAILKDLEIQQVINMFKKHNFIFFKECLYREIISLYNFYRLNINKSIQLDNKTQENVNEIVNNNFNLIKKCLGFNT